MQLPGLNGPAPTGLGRIGTSDFRSGDLKTICEYSPQVALARYWKIPFVPFVQSITANFTNPIDTIGPFGLDNNSVPRLNMVSVVDAMMLHVDSPNLNAGNALQPILAWFFARQSGIQATLQCNTTGYVVAPNFTPIDTLVSMMTEQWPYGWMLDGSQAPRMQFTTAIALPAVPTTVTVTFRMWTPSNARLMVGMTDFKAVEILVGAGILTADDAKQFTSLGG